jgi:DNA-binding transcriptional regulator WhiA
LADEYNKEYETSFSKSAINHWMRKIMLVKKYD